MTNEEKIEVMETVEVAEEEKSEKKALPWWKNRRAQYGLIAGACALVIAGGAGIAIASNQPAPAEEAEPAPTAQVEQVSSHTLKVTLDLPEWSEGSTPALLEVNDGVATTQTAIESASPRADITLENGTYTVSLVSPINADGSIYVVSDAQTLTLDGTTGANVEAHFTGTKLPAEDVTEAQINAIKDAFNKAKDAEKVEQEAVDKATNNANAGTDARNSKTDEEKQQAQDAAKQETASKQEATASQNSNSANNANSGSNTGNSGSASHTHSWTPVYKTVHHDAVTHTEDTYDTVWKSAVYCQKHKQPYTGNYCPLGNDYGTGHCLASSTVKEWQEQVKTGTKTVTDSAAYDEQVIDHYSCSCGATK